MNNKFYDYVRDGVTQGLLSSFMTCRMKAKWFLDGWSSPKVSGALTYGTIIHGVLEQVYDLIRLKKLKELPDLKLIKKLVKDVELQWKKENPAANAEALDELDTCCLIAEATLPEYFKFWWKKDLKELEWRQLEQKFAIPYKTKDGRITIIRGKKDGVFGKKIIKLFETKTKSMVSVDDLIDTLWFELQVNLYLWAIKQTYKQVPEGVTYNIIRKTNIYMKKGESKLVYAKKVADDIKKRPKHYFIRLNVKITPQEMKEFEDNLEAMVVDFMNWCEGKSGTYRNTSACIGKYGRCSWLGLCSKKDFGAYKKRKTVFRELEDL